MLRRVPPFLPRCVCSQVVDLVLYDLTKYCELLIGLILHVPYIICQEPSQKYIVFKSAYRNTNLIYIRHRVLFSFWLDISAKPAFVRCRPYLEYHINVKLLLHDCNIVMMHLPNDMVCVLQALRQEPYQW